MTSYDEVIKNLTAADVRLTNVMLSLLPYVFTQEETLVLTNAANLRPSDAPDAGEYSDQSVAFTVNKKAQSLEKDESGTLRYVMKTIANDPTLSKYAYVVVKDSPSVLSLVNEEEQAMTFLNGVGNTILQTNPEYAAKLMAWQQHNSINNLQQGVVENVAV